MFSRIIILWVFVGCALSIPIDDGYRPMENPYLFEGDILMEDGEDRNAVVRDNQKWPNGRIPYHIEAELADKVEVIEAAMRHIEKKTCLQFVPRTSEDKGYVNIFSGGGCFSHIGKTRGAQPLSLGPRCFAHGIIVHELGHAIGFYHEHSRSDRDEYLNIYLENIQEAFVNQFRKLSPSENILYDSFDYDSIMLYGETVFSKNVRGGLKTMTAKEEGRVLKRVVNKMGLSDSDVFRIKKMYNC